MRSCGLRIKIWPRAIVSSLRHNAITHQIMRWNTGTSYPAIEQLRSDRILVPAIPDDKQHELLEAAIYRNSR